MKSLRIALLIYVLLSVVAVASAIDPIDPTPADTLPQYDRSPRATGSVGLVLSGGGAKGIAHVGVIKALEDNDIPIDYVSGTSMGSIVGSLYSCGWSPDQMLELFTSKEFLNWSSGTIGDNNKWYYYQADPTPKWVSVNVSFTKMKESIPTQIIPTSLISPLPMNIEFLKLYGPYTEQCGEEFDNLFVPFRCVASDVYHKHKVVFHNGSLGDAVRASMSFPLVFRPIEIDSILMYDGGIYDNFPVDVMKEDFDPSFIIGVSVSGADSKPKSGNMYSQLEDMIIQNNDYSLPAEDGVKIQVPVLSFGVLDFGKARAIYDIGYRTGLSMVDSIKSRLASRRPLEEVTARRERFARNTPALMFDSVKVKGVEGSQARYLEYLFTGDRKDPVKIDRTVSAYYRAVTDGSLNNLLPQAEFGRDGKNTLLLEATPKRPWTLAVGGWLTTSTNSMLYLSGGYHTLGLNSLDMSLSGWIGQSYLAGLLDVKFALRTEIPSYLRLEGVMSRQKFYDEDVLFYKDSNPMFLTEVDNFLRASYVWAIGKKMKGFVSFAGGYISDNFYPGAEFTDGDRDLLQYRVGLLRMGVESNNLNNQMYPSSGFEIGAVLDLSIQSSRFKPEGKKMEGEEWKTRPVGSLELIWRKYFPVGKYWSIGAMANGVGTIRKLDQNYMNTLVHAPAFAPTPSTANYFNVAFRSDNYVAAGVMPVWMPFRNFQVRGDFYGYMPLRELRDNGRFHVASYDGWCRRLEFIGEVAVVYNLPFASISAYCNYLSSPARNWNFGLSFGLFFQAPKLLRR